MVVLVYLIFVILVTVLGSQRNIGGFATFFIALFLSPIIALIFVLISKEKTSVFMLNKQGVLVKWNERDISNGVYYIKKNNIGYVVYRELICGPEIVYSGTMIECVAFMRDKYKK